MLPAPSPADLATRAPRALIKSTVALQECFSPLWDEEPCTHGARRLWTKTLDKAMRWSQPLCIEASTTAEKEQE
jgi:hypothetical protein